MTTQANSRLPIASVLVWMGIMPICLHLSYMRGFNDAANEAVKISAGVFKSSAVESEHNATITLIKQQTKEIEQGVRFQADLMTWEHIDKTTELGKFLQLYDLRSVIDGPEHFDAKDIPHMQGRYKNVMFMDYGDGRIHVIRKTIGEILRDWDRTHPRLEEN